MIWLRVRYTLHTVTQKKKIVNKRKKFTQQTKQLSLSRLIHVINGWRGWFWWELGHLFCVPDTDDLKQQPWNNTKQIFPEQKTKKSFALRHLCPVHEVLCGILESINTWTNCQFIWSGKGYIRQSVWEFQKVFLWQPCLNKVIHVENWETDQLQHYLYVDISYKFTLAWVFVSPVCTQINKVLWTLSQMIWYSLQG